MPCFRHRHRRRESIGAAERRMPNAAGDQFCGNFAARRGHSFERSGLGVL